jgi:hypothetical protein
MKELLNSPNLNPRIESAEEVEALFEEGKVDQQDVIHFFLKGSLSAGADSEKYPQLKLAYHLLLTTIIGCGAIATYSIYQSQQMIPAPPAAIAALNSSVIPFAERTANLEQSAVVMSHPKGWQAVEVKRGVTAYIPPTDAVEVVQPTAPSATAVTAGLSELGLDGTRKPYVTELSFADLTPNPAREGLYSWSGVWEGEGYTRELDQQARLVADREGGKDIFLVVTYDKTITDPNQPNLRITVHNTQDVTGQLTNISAFLMEAGTGKAIARKDFEQLPPQYDVTVAFNSHFSKMETKTMNPLGEVVFSYHVAAKDIEKEFPLKLQAENQLFEQRLWEIHTLQSQGWVVKEVPQS